MHTPKVMKLESLACPSGAVSCLSQRHYILWTGRARGQTANPIIISQPLTTANFFFFYFSLFGFSEFPFSSSPTILHHYCPNSFSKPILVSTYLVSLHSPVILSNQTFTTNTSTTLTSHPTRTFPSPTCRV